MAKIKERRTEGQDEARNVAIKQAEVELLFVDLQERSWFIQFYHVLPWWHTTNGYKMAKVDVKGALIQTEMEGPPIHIKCNKRLMKLTAEVCAEE